LLHSSEYATALAPVLGYEKTAALIREAERKHMSIVALLKAKNILTKKQLRAFLQPLSLCGRL
jgi:aspartate ammonia-lyase